MQKENGYLQQDLFNPINKKLAFDIETEEIDDFRSLHTVGITCAAALSEDNDVVNWYGGRSDGSYKNKMQEAEVIEIVDFLLRKINDGYQIYTWNGLAFDFQILYSASGQDKRCIQIAQSHVDMMFHFFCIKGFAISMDKAAQGMGIVGKTEGMTGSKAPQMWLNSQYTEVLEYVKQDARATLELAKTCEQEKVIRWISKRGRPLSCDLKEGWLSVEQALVLPKPDTSWMDSPWPRSRFTKWLHA